MNKMPLDGFLTFFWLRETYFVRESNFVTPGLLEGFKFLAFPVGEGKSCWLEEEGVKIAWPHLWTRGLYHFYCLGNFSCPFLFSSFKWLGNINLLHWSYVTRKVLWKKGKDISLIWNSLRFPQGDFLLCFFRNPLWNSPYQKYDDLATFLTFKHIWCQFYKTQTLCKITFLYFAQPLNVTKKHWNIS